MNDSLRKLRAVAILTAVTSSLCLQAAASSSKAYNLGKVEGMDDFQGSAGARALLERNGFVVADPFFKQIFEPYIHAELPLFITTDSAWHTYHVLLEEGVKQLEETQAKRLARFSAKLRETASAKATAAEADFADLVRFASIGLAFQDAKHRESLSPAEKELIATLTSGAGEVQCPVGFPLSAANFRAASFYTQSSELSDYFAARQWYASVVFRLADARETRLALQLTRLVQDDSSLSNLWQQLSVPFDLLLAPAEDGDVPRYGAISARLFANGAVLSDALLAEAQKNLGAQILNPRVNDQLLSPGDYAQFGRHIKGFRLLPPRQLPCAVTFHHTTDPAIRGRMMPSGLDFLVASPTLRSPAAVRALEAQAGKEVAAAVQKFNCEPFPNTLHGEAMKLLAELQKPLPDHVAPALRTEAWADSQLWTQLGAWAEQRHTWALHTKLSVTYMGGTDTPTGIVAPHPDFFVGLASLSRKTAGTLELAGLTEPFDARLAAREMLTQMALHKQLSSPEGQSRFRGEREWMMQAERAAQFARFYHSYFEKVAKGLKGAPAFRKAEEKAKADLETLARRAAESGPASASDEETLKQFAAAAREPIAKLLSEFAQVCDRLAELARKSLTGQKLTEAEGNWISGYGTTLARFHFYEGNSYLVPRDDFPIATRVFANPFKGSILYAGLSRPQALYVIVPGGAKQQLYRGAVMTYREFARNADTPLDDEAWRKLVSDGLTPPPPAFTRSFYAEADAKELLELIRKETNRKPVRRLDEDDYDPSPRAEQAAHLLRTRATEADLPELLAVLRMLKRGDGDVAVALVETSARLADPKDVPVFIALLTDLQVRGLGWPDDVMPALAEAIGSLAWESHQAELIRLLGSAKTDVAAAALHVLASRPNALDVAALAGGFDRQAPQTRRLYCRLLGKATNNAAAKDILLRATQDRDDSVRWQAINAMYAAQWKDADSVQALLNRLDDTNQCLRAGAAFTLGKLGATGTAPTLLEKLRSGKKSPPISPEDWRRQITAVAARQMDRARWPEERGLPDYFPTDVMLTNRHRADLMSIFRPKNLQFSLGMGFTFERAAIGALRELAYTPAGEFLLPELGGENHSAAFGALKALGTPGLEQTLLKLALNREAEGTRRGLALNALCDLPAKARVSDLLPLLDETVIICSMRQGADWRLCDHAACVMAKLLDWDTTGKILTDQLWRDELIQKLRDWAATKP